MLLDYIKLREIKPELSGYVKEAESFLDTSAMPSDKTVHDVRILMKKSRAAMRLIRTQVDNEFYEKEYFTFRETGRIMRSWRETIVNRKILKEFRKKYPDIFKHLIDHENLNALMRKPDTARELPSEIKRDLELVILQLKKSGFRIRFHAMNNLNPDLLLNELEATYMLVTDRYLIARNNQNTNNLHEFRKKSKDFLYQLYFFRPVKPKIVKDLEIRLDAMTSDLGRYNDLAGLVKALDYEYNSSANTPSMDELILRIRHEQDKCLMKVWPAAYKIFCPGQKLNKHLGFKMISI